MVELKGRVNSLALLSNQLGRRKKIELVSNPARGGGVDSINLFTSKCFPPLEGVKTSFIPEGYSRLFCIVRYSCLIRFLSELLLDYICRSKSLVTNQS